VGAAANVLEGSSDAFAACFMSACSGARPNRVRRRARLADLIDGPGEGGFADPRFQTLLDTINEASGWLRRAVANLAEAAITNDSGFRTLLPTNAVIQHQNAGGRIRTRRLRPSGPVSSTVCP
jgi:hypothetical protein